MIHNLEQQLKQIKTQYKKFVTEMGDNDSPELRDQADNLATELQLKTK